MKNLVIAALVASTTAVRHKSMHKSAAEALNESEMEAQWFLFDDVYNWLYCKYRKCDYDQKNPTAEGSQSASYRNTGSVTNSDQTGQMGHAGQVFSDGASQGKHDSVDHKSDAHVDKDGTYGEVQHQEYDPGAAFVRMSGA